MSKKERILRAAIPGVLITGVLIAGGGLHLPLWSAIPVSVVMTLFGLALQSTV